MNSNDLLHRPIRRWEHFWFEDVPSDLFAVLRIVVGVAGLISLIGFVPVALFWSPDGIAPLPDGGFGLRNFVFQSGLGVPVGWTIFLTLFASFICMTMGLFTSTAVAVCFLGTAFQSHWNVLPLTSGHTVLVALLFALVWADCGTRLSVDVWRRQRTSRQTASRDSAPSINPDVQPIWPLRLIRAQIALVYLASGFFKLVGSGWRDGSAIHYTTAQNVYGRIFHLYAIPASFDWMLTLATYTTLFWEIAFAFLLLNRVTRKIALVVGVGVHLGIWALMEVGPFSGVMIASYVAFLDPHWAARFAQTRLAPFIPSRTAAEAAGSTVTSTSAA